MTARKHSINEPARAAMIELAKACGWPRVKFPRKTAGGIVDAIGPGVTGWYLAAEQLSSDVVDAATTSLLNVDRLSAEMTRPPGANLAANLVTHVTADGDEEPL